MITESIFSTFLLEHSLWGVLLVDTVQETIESANPKASSILGDLSNRIIGRLFSDFVPFEKEINSNTHFYKNDGFYGEIYLRRENESLIPVQVAVKILRHENQELSLISFYDISAQKKMQRDLMVKHEGLKELMNELTDKNNELLQLDKAKDKFLSLVTHELRTPLNTIVATSEIIHFKMYNTEDEFNVLAKNLYEQGHHILDLVNDILDLTKIHSGSLEFYIEELDIRDPIETQITIFKDMAEKNSTKIEFKKPIEPVLCYFDSVRINQIIGNLLGNAIKFNKKNGHVIINLLKKENAIEFSIKDDGIGIPANKFESIFNEFETIENIANHHKGTGLGLPIVKLLVEAHGGKISLISQLGAGTTFTVSLPTQKVLMSEFYRSRHSNDSFILFDDDSNKN